MRTHMYTYIYIYTSIYIYIYIYIYICHVPRTARLKVAECLRQPHNACFPDSTVGQMSECTIPE